MKASTLRVIMNAVELMYEKLSDDVVEAGEKGWNEEYKNSIHEIIRNVDTFTDAVQGSLEEHGIEYNA